MEYVFPSLLFVKDNIDKLIRDIHYYKGDIRDSSNLMTNTIVLNECHRIMVSNDIYCKNNFNYQEEVDKMYETFWNIVSQILN